MIGVLNTQHREVTVVGAGIAGMLAAYFLDQKGYEVTLLEAAERAGGLIHTSTTEWGIAESAAHSFLATPVVQALCRDLSVELLPIKRDSRARYIVRDGRMRRFPLRLGEALRLGARLLTARTPADDLADLSVADWARRHLGQPALDYLVAPFLLGIYGCLPEEVNVNAAFPGLVVPPGKTFLSRPKTTVTRAPRPMMAPRGGMGALVERLESRLEQRLGDRFKKGERVTKLPMVPNLVLSVPAGAAAELLIREDPGLALRLRDIEYVPLVSVTAFFRESDFARLPRGVGMLCPPAETRNILGVLFNSSSFESRVPDGMDYASFTIMMGGSIDPGIVHEPDEEIRRIVVGEFRELLGCTGEPLHLEIHRWQRAIPKYGMKLPATWESAQRGWCSRPGQILFGNYTGQVSLRGMVESAAGFHSTSSS